MPTRGIEPRANGEGAVGSRDCKWGEVNAVNGSFENLSAANGSFGNIYDKNSVDAALATKAPLAAVGSPLVAHTAAEMTDTTKVYVYTGNEEGYQYGHWYYHNGTVWADGGAYYATEVETDKTLSVSDEAADAKAVGDRFDRDESKISGLTTDVNALYTENRQQTDIINQMKTSMELKSVGLTDNDGVPFEDMDGVDINAFEYLPITDKTLSKKDVPADAAAVKEKLDFNYKAYTYLYGWGDTALFGKSETNIPVLSVVGTIPTIKEEGKLDIDYELTKPRLKGSGTISIQGQTSASFPKKNYNIKFDDKVVLKDGWVAAKTYTLKGNFNDFTYARNTVNARLWGQCVRSRTSWQKDNIKDNQSNTIVDNNGDNLQVYDSIIPTLKNGGATDGFPIYLVTNGMYMGLYILQIKKDEHMFGMGATNDNRECIISNEGGGSLQAREFKELAEIDGHDYTFEYCVEEQESTMKESFNRMIQACIDSTGSSYENTLGQYLDIDSIIDYMIFSSLICGVDILVKNFLMVTYDGVKWYISAYDLDNAFGSYQDGGLNQLPTKSPTLIDWNNINRAAHLAYTYDTARLKARYEELRQTVFSESNIYLQFLKFMREIPLAAKIEETKLYPTTPSTSEMNLSQILNFYRLRVAALDTQVSALV